MNDQPPVRQSSVTYTTKELLEDIKRQVDSIASLLLAKADLSAVVSLTLKVDDNERRIRNLEQSDAIYVAQAQGRSRLFAGVVALIGVLVGLGMLLLALT